MANEVRRAVTVNKPRSELYAYWRRFENLPRFMGHLESVTETGPGRSHWVAKAPVGMEASWDAEIVEEREGELIAWRALPGSQLDNAGEVRFVDAPAGRGTEIHVTLTYNPPLGAVGALFAKIFGEEPEQQVREDLRNFKRVMETGEIPTIKGQPAGRGSGRDEAPVIQKDLDEQGQVGRDAPLGAMLAVASSEATA